MTSLRYLSLALLASLALMSSGCDRKADAPAGGGGAPAGGGGMTTTPPATPPAASGPAMPAS